MKTLEVPTLIVAGDEDEPCLEPALMMKRTIGTAGLAVIPKSGYTVNLEEPHAFNRMAYGLISTVEAGGWTPRDPRAVFRSLRG
jgi:pimeloyl-ACP methyl ester carboxylesterase